MLMMKIDLGILHIIKISRVLHEVEKISLKFNDNCKKS